MEIGKYMESPLGFGIIVITPEEWEKAKPQFEKERLNWTDYDSSLIDMHIANCGYGIIDEEYMTAIDDEFVLEDIYNMLNHK
jgi:hypothetical protein